MAGKVGAGKCDISKETRSTLVICGVHTNVPILGGDTSSSNLQYLKL